MAGNQNRQKGGRASERPADGGVLRTDSVGVRLYPRCQRHTVCGWPLLAGESLLQQPPDCCLPPRCAAAGEVAALSVGAAPPGGHPHLAGVPGLLPAPHHQGPEDAHAHRQGRRGQEPDRAGDALHLRGQHEHHQHPEGGEQPVQPRRPGEQAADGGR